MTQPCRHCGRVRQDRGRGLCGACYYRPEVRELYPPKQVGVLLTGIGAVEPTKPASRPCEFPPGSPEKLLALQGRAERGEWLWHPQDRSEQLAVVGEASDDGDELVRPGTVRLVRGPCHVDLADAWEN